MYKIILIVIFAAFAATNASSVDPLSELLFHKVEIMGENKERSMYFISTFTATWSNAGTFCLQMLDNKRLVSIENRDKNESIKQAIKPYGSKDYWTSGRFELPLGRLRWTATDIDIAWSDWNEGYGNRFNVRDCILVGNYDRMWWNREFDKEYYFICE